MVDLKTFLSLAMRNQSRLHVDITKCWFWGDVWGQEILNFHDPFI